MATRKLTGEPYKLLGHRLAFTNWLFVRPGSFNWVNERGEGAIVFGNEGPLDARFVPPTDPFGVRLVHHKAQRMGPIIDAQMPWEIGGASIGTIIEEDNRYRAWGALGWGDLADRGKHYFCYWESDDGLAWRRPSLGIVEENGSRDNNLLSLKGGTVFIDPIAPAAERYKWVNIERVSAVAYENWRARWPQETDPRCERNVGGTIYYGVTGAVSPDGLRWKKLDEPIGMMHADTQPICYYDVHLEKYVLYVRDWMVPPLSSHIDRYDENQWLRTARRAIGRTESNDFRHFPLSQIVLEPPTWLDGNAVLYTNCYTTIPHAPEQHLMFPAVWDAASDSTAIYLATSSDGRVWELSPGEPLLETNEFGQFDGGAIFAAPNLIELLNGDWALPYTGYNVPHKYPRRQATRAVGYAVWPKGRLMGIESQERGGFSTIAVIPPAQRLTINASTKRSGEILVQAEDLQLRPIAGRTFDDAIPMFADLPRTPVRWKEHDDLGISPGEAVVLRFKLRQATVYALDFK